MHTERNSLIVSSVFQVFDIQEALTGVPDEYRNYNPKKGPFEIVELALCQTEQLDKIIRNFYRCWELFFHPSMPELVAQRRYIREQLAEKAAGPLGVISKTAQAAMAIQKQTDPILRAMQTHAQLAENLNQQNNWTSFLQSGDSTKIRWNQVWEKIAKYALYSPQALIKAHDLLIQIENYYVNSSM